MIVHRYFEMIFSVVASLIGTIFLYYSNGGPNGNDFIHRYIVLGWVVSVQVFSFFILIVFLLYFVAGFVGISFAQTAWFDVLVIIFSNN